MRQTAIVLAALLAIPATVAAQESEGGELVEDVVYRCDVDGVRRYSARRIPGADCSTIGYSFVRDALDLPLPAGWVPVTQDNEGVISYYRAKDVRRSGDLVTLWILDNHPKDTYVPNTGIGTFRSSIQRMEVNCRERSLRTVQAAFYAGSSGEGKFVGSPSTRGSTHHYAVPGSSGEMIVDRACALEP